MLKKFHDRLKDSVTAGSVNIVCFGDSVTQGCFGSGIDMHDDIEEFCTYHVKLKRALTTLFPGKVFNVINSGIGGDNAEMGLARIDRDVLCYRPDLVIVAFGVNDHPLGNRYEECLAKIFEILAEKDIPCIYMTEHMMNTYCEPNCTSPQYLEYSKLTAKLQTDGTMDDLFERGRKCAKEHGVAICDVYSKWKALYKYGVDVTMLLANRINHPQPAMHDLFVSSLISTMFFEGNE